MGTAIIFFNPLLFATIGFAVIRFRKLSLADDVGFRPFAAKDLLIWGGAFLVLAVAQEVISNAAGLESSAGSWRGKYGEADLAVRILAVGLLYPIAEEFLFRGVILGAFSRKFGPAAAVILSAIAFAVVHVQYDLIGMGFILADGLLFGAARVLGRSVYLPMIFHVLGNSYAVWERIYG